MSLLCMLLPFCQIQHYKLGTELLRNCDLFVLLYKLVIGPTIVIVTILQLLLAVTKFGVQTFSEELNHGVCRFLQMSSCLQRFFHCLLKRSGV